MTTEKNPFGHTISYETYRAWDLDMTKQLRGIAERVWFVRCDCECGWTGTWKFQDLKTEPQRHHIEQIVLPRTIHDTEVGLVTTFG